MEVTLALRPRETIADGLQSLSSSTWTGSGATGNSVGFVSAAILVSSLINSFLLHPDDDTLLGQQ